MRVNVHCLTSQKADEGLTSLLREINHEAAWRRNGGDERNSAGEGFLDDLKRHPAADEQDVLVERQQAMHERVAENLVERVVTAHVLAQNDEIA